MAKFPENPAVALKKDCPRTENAKRQTTGVTELWPWLVFKTRIFSGIQP